MSRYCLNSLILVLLCSALALPASAPGWRQAAAGYRYQFPRDHFAHRDFQTEWWYYTGNLRAAGGHRYGFELVFFRRGQDSTASDNPSVWRVDDLYLAHLALTDIDDKQFRSYQRLNRAGPGIAGVDFETGRIWNANWQAQWNKATGEQTLSAVAAGIRFTLHLTPDTPPIIHGEDGVSRKAAGEGQASHYVSLPRLEVSGTLNGAAVNGTAWMDHEWFSNLLDAGQRGWDWFSIQLEDGSELMLFQLRRLDGGKDAFSSGTYIARDGTTTHLMNADFSLEPLATWTSVATHGSYPIKWRISVPRLKLTLECAAAIPNQELVPEDSGGNAYWEGAVTYRGTAAGVGYLEMTGYAAPVKLNK